MEFGLLCGRLERGGGEVGRIGESLRRNSRGDDERKQVIDDR